MNPLTSVKGFAEILQVYPEIDNESRQGLISIIASESERLIRLINDLFELPKIETGKIMWSGDKVSLKDAIDRPVFLTRTLG